MHTHPHPRTYDEVDLFKNKNLWKDYLGNENNKKRPEIDTQPYFYEKDTSLTNCDFKSVCSNMGRLVPTDNIF